MSESVTRALHALQALGFTVLNVGPRWSDLVRHEKGFDIRIMIESDVQYPQLHVLQCNGADTRGLASAILEATEAFDSAVMESKFSEYDQMEPTKS